jgi:hypothetical protein
MTVAAVTPTVRYAYTGPGTYTFPFETEKAAHITVFYTSTIGIVSTLNPASDYSVALVDGIDGGSLDVVAPADAGGVLTIRRILEITQEVDWVNNDPLDAETLEASFDREIMIMQQLDVLVQEGLVNSSWRGEWVGLTEYYVNDLITGDDTNIYTSLFGHTSTNDFATDVASGYWGLVIDVAAVKAYSDAAEAAAASMPSEAEINEILDAVEGIDAAVEATALDRANTNAAVSNSVQTMAGLVGLDPVYPSIRLMGFYEAGDGGGGEFFWQSTEPKTNHNGGTIIDPATTVTPGDAGWWTTTSVSGTGCWIRLNRVKLFANSFGAKGDSITDSSAAVQAAINLYRTTYAGGVLSFKRGGYLIGTSLNCTYDGVAAGLTSGYYGFTIAGEDRFNTRFIGACAGMPVLDMTGKNRMQVRDIGFVNNTDGAHNPSCAILLARNLTNGGAGNHVFWNVSVGGYYTETGIQTASSEVNRWYNCDIENTGPGSCIELTEQIDTGVVSAYIDLTSHTFSGGNTWHLFNGCAFLAYSATEAGVTLNMINNLTLNGCYINAGSGAVAAFRMTGDCWNTEFTNIREESDSGYFLQVMDDVEVYGLKVTGRTTRAIRGEDGSKITHSSIRPTYIYTDTAISFDAYDFEFSELSGNTGNVVVRNSAYRSRFFDQRIASGWSLPTGSLKAPEFYYKGYTGAQEVYVRKIADTNPYTRDQFGVVETKGLVLRELAVPAASGTYTVDYRDGCNFAFTVTGALSIQGPSNLGLGDDDGYGQIIVLAFKQDATGGHAVTFGSFYQLNGGTVNTAANSTTVWRFLRTSLSSQLQRIV